MLISALEHGDRIAVLERDHGLLPPSRRPAGAATGDRVAAHLHRAHARGRHPEQLVQRVPDLVLVGLGVHLEGVHLARLVGGRALLGHHRADDDLVQRRHYLLPFFFGLPFGADLAGFRAAFFAALAGLFLAAFAYGSTSTVGMLRPLRYTASLEAAVSSRTLRPSRPRLASRPASCAVFGPRNANRSTTWRAPSRARALSALFRASCFTLRGMSVR